MVTPLSFTVTPEQLAKWRKEFEAVTGSRPMLAVLLYQKFDDGKYRNNSVESEWQGYLRAKQETEQAIKDVDKLRIVVINLIAACEEREGDDGERCYLVRAQEFDDLQELLND